MRGEHFTKARGLKTAATGLVVTAKAAGLKMKLLENDYESDRVCGSVVGSRFAGVRSADSYRPRTYEMDCGG